MKILIIGGSYFFGRVYSLYAAEEHDVTIFNRGTYPMGLNCREIHGDRNKEEDIAGIPAEKYDAIIDFCAYNQGDIEFFIEHFSGSFRQYIFISTGDVLKRLPYDGTAKKEDAPLEDQTLEGAEGQYIAGKIALEGEVRRVAKEKNAHYTILRPGVLYGPYNYAPRESEFVRQIVTVGKVYLPLDADMKYSLCYIKDAALLALAITGDEKAYDEVFHLAGGEATGDQIADALILASETDAQKDYYPEHVLTASEIFVPFGGSESETQTYDGSKIAKLTGRTYTDLKEGMAKTYRAFANIFQPISPKEE